MADRYARLKWWEIWNFMSIEHARIEFDEQNVINIKGYNDSGKSACLQALRVCFTNSDTNSQVKFIQDGKDYFRIAAYFDDDVMIIRDKYRNGQSLYEVYQSDNLLFTTKTEKGLLTKVTKVPEEIEKYLGLIIFDGKSLNIRSCFEKQLGVQTTGSENYQMFNQVLKSEEIAMASALLNTDKNRQAQVATSLENELRANRDLLSTLHTIDDATLQALKDHDALLEEVSAKSDVLEDIISDSNEADSIKVNEPLATIDITQLNAVADVKSKCDDYDNLVIIPELPTINDDALTLLDAIHGFSEEINGIQTVSLPEIADVEQLKLLDNVAILCNSVKAVEDTIENANKEIENARNEQEEISAQLEQSGIKLVKCPNCGEYFSPENAEQHMQEVAS